MLFYETYAKIIIEKNINTSKYCILLMERQVLYMNHVITIGRELGSGGRTVGKEVARLLNIPYYDRELIDEAAKESGLSSDFIESNEQEITSSFLYNLAMGNSYTYGMLGLGGTNSMPLAMQVFLAQQKVIQRYAASPCVIVGRCADFILRDKPNVLKVFIYASLENRIKRAVEEYGCSQKKALDVITKSDKGRARHYATFTDWDWSDRRNYDMLLNAGSLGIDAAAQMICRAVQ